MVEELKTLIKEKRIMIPLCVVMVLSYLYLWTHPSMGVDDTAMYRYFQDGYAPHYGRWTVFLLAKLVHLIDFTPVVVDAVGVALIALSGLIIYSGLRRSSGGKLDVMACTILVCFMISYPLINEVYEYYLHNGLGVAYVLTAVSYYLIRFGEKKRDLIYAALMLAPAISCYETVAEVFLLLLFMDTLLRMTWGEENITWKQWFVLFGKCCVAIVAAMILKTWIAHLVLWAVDMEPYFHSIGKELQWIFSEDALSTIISMIKGFGRYYVLNATVNFAIAMFWAAMIIFAVFGLGQVIKKKSMLLLLNVIGIFGISWVITLVEGNTGAYRTMQTFPVLVAVAMMVLYHWLMAVNRKKILRNIGLVIVMICLYNQVYDTNKWYYVDYMKYEEEKAICHELAYDIKREATMDKPMIFVGRIEEYGTIDTYMCVRPDSWQYRLFAKLDGTTETDKKYEIVQNPAWYSVFAWGVDAFDEQATEIANFFAYHGYPIEVATREEKWEILKEVQDMPVWPKEGSIVEMNDYVIVKLGEEAPRE